MVEEGLEKGVFYRSGNPGVSEVWSTSADGLDETLLLFAHGGRHDFCVSLYMFPQTSARQLPPLPEGQQTLFIA